MDQYSGRIRPPPPNAEGSDKCAATVLFLPSNNRWHSLSLCRRSVEHRLGTGGGGEGSLEGGRGLFSPGGIGCEWGAPRCFLRLGESEGPSQTGLAGYPFVLRLEKYVHLAGQQTHPSSDTNLLYFKRRWCPGQTPIASSVVQSGFTVLAKDCETTEGTHPEREVQMPLPRCNSRPSSLSSLQ